MHGCGYVHMAFHMDASQKCYLTVTREKKYNIFELFLSRCKVKTERQREGETSRGGGKEAYVLV